MPGSSAAASASGRVDTEPYRVQQQLDARARRMASREHSGDHDDTAINPHVASIHELEAPSTAATVTTQQATTPTQPATGSATPQAASGVKPRYQGMLRKQGRQCPGADVKTTVTKVDSGPGSAELDPTHSFQCSVHNPAC